MTPAPTFRFHRFELRPASRELCADGVPQRLGERAFDLLLALAEAGGAVVSRDALFERAWPGRVVIDDNLKVQVMALRKLLGPEAVVTVPGRGYRLGWPLLDSPDAAPPAVPPAAPDPSRLFGREAELARLRSALAAGRLLTVTGPGGIGKTRLAAAAADAERGRWPDGVAWVELAALTEPDAMPAAVAHALRLPAGPRPVDAAGIARALRPLQLLLVLDNCEHLLPAAAALLSAIAAAAPQVALLATSQVRLDIAGEAVLALDGLALSPADAAPDAAQRSPSEALFAARVRTVAPQIELDSPADVSLARQICHRLDGLPLALELAAARVPALGLAGVLQRLDHQLQLLTRGPAHAPPRQQTLRATLAWSHELLDEVQRVVFRRLGIFADRFTLDDAQAVAADQSIDEWAVLDAVDDLVARSLLRPLDPVGGAGERRYRLLVHARAYALEQLEAAAEHDAVMRRLADHLVRSFVAAEQGFLHAALGPWVDALWPRLHDLRAALQWAARQPAEADRLLALASAAGPFWAAANLDREAAPWLERVRPLGEAPGLADEPLARYCKAVAFRLVNPTAPVAESVAAAERGAELFERLGDHASAYRLLGLVAQHGRRIDPQRDWQPLFQRLRALERPEWSATMRLTRLRAEGVAQARAGDWAGYRERFQLEAALLAEAGDALRAWGASYHVALAELALKRPAAAIAVLEPMVAQVRAAGLLRELWTRPVLLALARIEAGQGAEAAPAVREAVTLLRVAGAHAWCADHFAWWALDCGEPALGARLAGWADATVRRNGQPRHAHARAAHEQASLRLAVKLPPAAREALRAEGEAFDDELALLRVLQLADALITR
ncbi:ATP-binding protein [Aquabacterium humicola]|uniref:ATP-binding protein n=1 Tax=Aquabacterium humicola TaxID=3237377 RepID=UPI002542B61F|nr:winged helix-turn-helix domain-containing protein [Rubrivivax pictus]